jgi:predicted nucleotidyltransferase component of viral defense system
MTLAIIQERLKKYACLSVQEEEQALREITQEVVLAGLARTDFFKYARFHGGTCLRIFHGIERFSEDLDFVLEQEDPEFPLERYLEAGLRELSAYGFSFEIGDRSKAEAAVKKAFVKDDSIGKLLDLQFIRPDRSMKKIRIKIEVDTRPPSGARSVTRYLTFPFPASIAIHDIGSLFSGKLHALLCREYIKGRDWYDFVWYLSQGEQVNYQLLSSQIDQTGPWKGQGISVCEQWCFNEVKKKAQALDWAAARREVGPFVRERERPSLELWSADFFCSLVDDYLVRRSDPGTQGAERL